MFCSLPTLAPHSPHSLFHPSLASQSPTSAQARGLNHPNPNHNTPPQHSQANVPQRTLLSVLRADENAVLIRNATIRRFGAGWLKPVGVAKTLQGLADEKAEREEVEAGEREFAPVSPRSLPSVVSPTDDRDLDDEVPDADEAEGGWMDDEDGEPDDGGMDALMDGEGDGDFVQDDLDADIPDGEGRYEHTDTEVEDESSFEGEGVLGRSSVWGVGGGGVEMGGERPRRSTGREG